MEKIILTVLGLSLLSACGPKDFSTSVTVVGKDGASGATGATGQKGDTGPIGPSGANGKNCTVKQLSNGAIISCPDGSSAAIYNGKDGEDGEDAPKVIGIHSYIKPCLDEFANDEIFIRLTDGNILAVYDGGPHEDRLVLVAPGDYITTDRDRNKTCHLNVDQYLNVKDELGNIWKNPTL